MWQLAALAVLAAAPEFEIRTTDGQTVVGALTRCSVESLSLSTAEGERTFRLDQLARLTRSGASFPPAAASRAQVDLIDGSTVPAESVEASGKTVAVTRSDGETFTAPVAALNAVRLRASDVAFDSAWDELLAADRPGDLLVLRKKNALDYVAGELGKLDGESVELKVDGAVRSVKLSRVEGLVYLRRASARLPDAAFTLVDASGARWQVASAELLDGQLAVQTPAGVKISTPLERIAAIEFKLQYLSDLKPEKTTIVPYLGEPSVAEALASLYAPRMDENWRGEPLMLDGVKYAKGLSLHSKTELLYRLPAGKFSRLQAIAGIDDSVRPNGSCTLEVLGDDQSLLRIEILGASSPQSIDVSITGVRKLQIVVDYGADLDTADCLDLVEARLLP